MTIGVPKETRPGERRVGLVPASLAKLSKAGHQVVIESGAGAEAGFLDEAYLHEGARVVVSRDEVFRAADLIVQVLGYGANPEAGEGDLRLLRPGQGLIGFLDPLGAPARIATLATTGVTSFAMELMPRITRAQSMDALSSMATIAGYKAVLLAAGELPKMFPMLMTAAGTVLAARVFIVGAGVAGLQAIATAKRLGAAVHAYDVRPAVKEQVESVGAKFVELEVQATQAETRGGYAAAQDESFYRRQRELMTRVVAQSDVVITTAAVPGKRAPVLVTREMVAAMAHGSVIVDLAAERGGNCEVTRPGETVVEHGVTILGPVNLPATVPAHASQMYAGNVGAFLLHIVKDGKLRLDEDDQIIKETTVTRDGAVVHPQLQPVGAA